MKRINDTQINNIIYYLILTILPLISFYGSIYQLSLHYDGFHHGLVYSMTEDFLQGRVPYKDFFNHYGISFILINSIFVKIFSNSIFGLYFVTSLTYSISLIIVCIIIRTLNFLL